LRTLAPDNQALLLVPSAHAGLWLVADVVSQLGEARLGWQRRTLAQHAQALAWPIMLARGMQMVDAAASCALCARVVQTLREQGELGRFAAVSGRPGFVPALWRTLCELRLARLDAQRVESVDAELARCLSAYEAVLAELRLCDLAELYTLASQRADVATRKQSLLALDVAIEHRAEAQFLSALCVHVERAWACVPSGDEPSLAAFRAAFGPDVQEEYAEAVQDGELGRVQARLFAGEPARDLTTPEHEPAAAHERGRSASQPETEPEPHSPREVRLLSCPNESREAAEVVREILIAARSGVPLDRMAVVVHAVEHYRSVLEECFARAGVPAHFASGVRLPLPEGRAFALLLSCAQHGLSAARFAEYLSLGVLPKSLVPQSSLANSELEATSSPRHWEKWLMPGALSAGRAHWQRRLHGVLAQWQSELDNLPEDAPQRETLERQKRALSELEAFASPVLEALEALPAAASCGQWWPLLSQLAERSLRDPSAVLELLTQLAPLGAHTQLSLRELSALLTPYLQALVAPSDGNGAGRVFVCATSEVRGRSFERVFVVGLAERMLPARVRPDPLLTDARRRALSPDLACAAEHVARQRLALRLAVGAADAQLCMTFPRFDAEQMRPRVPSFYVLEALEAVSGRTLGIGELLTRAERGAAAHLGWPAPERPEQAIDDAEYDLSVLARAAQQAAATSGTLRYLVAHNPFVARALRTRWQRWHTPKFTPADGCVVTRPHALQRFATQLPTARSYSVSALEQLSICPYRFYLHAIARIAPAERPSEPSELTARERGVLMHAVLNQTLLRLLEHAPGKFSEIAQADAERALEEAFTEVSDRARAHYAPAIARVFDAALQSVRRDLQGWLTRARQDEQWTPHQSELSLQDPQVSQGSIEPTAEETESVIPSPLSPAAPHPPPPAAGGAVTLQLAAGVRLSGCVDLVEVHTRTTPDGKRMLRATDFKTGAAPLRLAISNGAHVLQPLLYALALERMCPDAAVSGGRLYFSTHDERFQSREVPLSARARDAAEQFFLGLQELLSQGFLPAAPERDACASCAYLAVCGPHEAERAHVKRRDSARLNALMRIRGLP